METTQEPRCLDCNFIALAEAVARVLQGENGDRSNGDSPSVPVALVYLQEKKIHASWSIGEDNTNFQILTFAILFFFFPRFTPQKKKKKTKPDSQPAVVAVGDLGHLSGDARHLEVIHLEDPAPRDVDVGGLGDVYDGVGAGAGDVVVVGFISAVEAGLKIGKKRRIWGLNTTLHGISFMGQPSNVGVVDPNLLLLMLLTPTFCWCC